MPPPDDPPLHVVSVDDVRAGYPGRVVLDHVAFDVPRGTIFAIMGGSGCGKSTLLRHIAGLNPPLAGRIRLFGLDFSSAPRARQREIQRRFGLCFQQGALFSSLTVSENIALPLEESTDLGPDDIRHIADLKLALVGLAGAGDLYPSSLSGGMRKRAALARALALDPDLLLFDEPSAGLDPITSRRLDDLIVALRDRTGATILLVTHELPTILGICDDAVMLDASTRSVIARGPPRDLLEHPPHTAVREFLTRGGTAGPP